LASQARIVVIDLNEVKLLASTGLSMLIEAERTAEALRAWLLDRCERPQLWSALRDGTTQPRTRTVSQLADRLDSDRTSSPSPSSTRPTIWASVTLPDYPSCFAVLWCCSRSVGRGDTPVTPG
jgi:hypothetical protein